MVKHATLRAGGYFIMIFALIFSIFSGIAGYQMIASRNWPSTEGVIIDHIVQEKTCSSNETKYVPQIVYQYSVSNSLYNSSTIQAGSGYSCYDSRSQAERHEMFTKYPVGLNVSVFYSPKNPSNSALVVGTTRAGLFFPIFTLLLWIFTWMLIDRRFVPFWNRYLEFSDIAQDSIRTGIERGDEILDHIDDNNHR